jgi:hypothetical protein
MSQQTSVNRQKVKIDEKSVHRFGVCNIRKDRQTDRHSEAESRNFCTMCYFATDINGSTFM